MRRRTGILLAGLLLGAGLLGAWRYRAVTEAAARETAVETSRVRTWARTRTAAGISVLPKRVPAAEEARLRDLRDLPGYHDFATRCASCHALPDPAAYPSRQWVGKVAEMQEHIRRAGLMPPTEDELRGAVWFLEAAADSLRP